MTVTVVRTFKETPAGGLLVETEPGYELLGKFLSSDLFGIESDEYHDVRQAVAAGLRGETVEEIVGNAFALQVEGAESTLILVHRSNRTLTMATEVLQAALDQYADFMRDGESDPVSRR